MRRDRNHPLPFAASVIGLLVVGAATGWDIGAAVVYVTGFLIGGFGTAFNAHWRRGR